MIIVLLFDIDITTFANAIVELIPSEDYYSEIKLCDSNKNVSAYYYELNLAGYNA